jgi:molybdopterin-synthase adenylyltransferase
VVVPFGQIRPTFAVTVATNPSRCSSTTRCISGDSLTARLSRSTRRTRNRHPQFTASAAASLLAQYVSLNTAPGGLGEPGPVQYLLSSHTLEHLSGGSRLACPVEALSGHGDHAMRMTGPHPGAHAERRNHEYRQLPVGLQLLRTLDDALHRLQATRIRRPHRHLHRRVSG